MVKNMLYARHAGERTIVAAADTLAEFEAFNDIVTGLRPSPFVIFERPDAVDLMSEDDYTGLRTSPYVFSHADSEQRDAFVATCNIKLLRFREALVERQQKMLASDHLDPYVEGVDERTISQIYGLDQDDRWDKRSDEQKAKDEEWRKRADDLRKAGKLSSDSFAPVTDDTKASDKIHVSKIEAVQEKDGSITVTDVSAHKIMGDSIYGPASPDQPVEDVSDDLRIGDGSASIFHRLDIVGKNLGEITALTTQCGFDLSKRSVASKDTKTGCWVALERQDSAMVIEEALRGMGVDVSLTTVNDLGQAILPKGIRVVEEAVIAQPARPWNGRQSEIDALDDEGRKAWVKGVEGAEFLFAGDYHGPKHGCSLFIAPKTYFVAEGEMYPSPLDIAHLLPSDCKEVAPGQYSTMSRDWMTLSHDLLKRGFTESLILRIYVNNL